MVKDKRVEVLFEPSEYRILEDAAQRQGKSVGAMVREAVVKYVTGPSQEKREAAIKHLRSLQGQGGPVGSPEEIKAEIMAGIDEYLDKKLEAD